MTHKHKKQDKPHPDPLGWGEWNVLCDWVTICCDMNGDDCESCPKVKACCKIWDFLNDYIKAEVTFNWKETGGKGEVSPRARYDSKLYEEILRLAQEQSDDCT